MIPLYDLEDLSGALNTYIYIYIESCLVSSNFTAPFPALHKSKKCCRHIAHKSSSTAPVQASTSPPACFQHHKMFPTQQTHTQHINILVDFNTTQLTTQLTTTQHSATDATGATDATLSTKRRSQSRSNQIPLAIRFSQFSLYLSTTLILYLSLSLSL